MNKSFFLILGGVLIAGAALGFAFMGGDPAQEVPIQEQEISAQEQEIVAHTSIDYGNGEIQSFANEVVEQGDSALDLLDKLGQEKGIAIEKKDFPGLGEFVEAINGVHGSGDSYWQFWINGEYAQVGAGQYELKEGDEVLWKLTNEQPQ